MTVVVLQEGDEACRYRCNLLRRHVHKVYLGRCNYGEVGILTAFNHLADKGPVFVQRCVTLSNNVIFFLFGGEIYQILIVEIYYAIGNVAVRRFDKAKFVDVGVYAERRNKSDVRTFRALDGAKASIVRIVNVAHFETCTLARKTTRTESRKTTLVRNLG